MSFILDALRKSENARQRHGGPALAEVPIGRRRENRPWWIWAVAALLAINLIVLLVVLTRNPEPEAVLVPPVTAPPAAAVAVAPSPAPAAPATSSTASIPVQTAPAAAAQAPLPAPVRSLAEEAESSGPPLSADPDAPSAAIAAAGNVPDREPIVRAVTPGPAATSQTGGEENLPTLNELTGDRAVGMPPMHLDIHVYSANPAERFVFINNRKYIEGATLTEGPLVERIRTDGVVLNQRGFRFILPRQ